MAPINSVPFAVKDCALIAIATGREARTLRELQHQLEEVDVSSIYYHFWGGLLRPRFEERQYNNDFAAWAWHQLTTMPWPKGWRWSIPANLPSWRSCAQNCWGSSRNGSTKAEAGSLFQSDLPVQFIRSQIVVFDTQKRSTTPAEMARNSCPPFDRQYFLPLHRCPPPSVAARR